jgi:hypothetical protein
VELVRENEDAARCFQKVRGQVILAWNGERNYPVDINHLAVWAMIDAYGIKDRLGTFDKINRAWHEAEQKKRDSEG